ncbi:helix-turn-helix transcriptional regulator, partial [Mycobacterium avium]|nr:helix-turn-helix transcriptional regulator [Mycobacterium avium]
MRLRWPLTGRAEEMRLIEAVLWDPDPCGMVIHGSAGIGKSRIAREALSFAASKGCETHWAVATSSSQKIPLGAFAHWAGSAVGDTLQLVGSVIESLIAASGGSQVVIGVDDVSLLDDASTFVLHQIVQRRAAKLILTLRDGEPISAGTRELWKVAQFGRLDLRPLSPEETTELLLATLGGRLDPDAVRRLWNLTCGNVLYLRNIVEQEIADGRLVEQHGRWCWVGDPVVPPDLAELIESRIGALPAPVNDVVDVLAVGEPIELGSLTRITDPAAVEEADVRGLLTLDQVDGRVEVRVAHPLYAEVRKRRAAPTRLRRLRGLVAAELATAGRADVRAVVRRAVLSL